MARIRSTKPEFWDDDIVGSLTRDARLMFIATWNFADDEGLLRWSPDYLMGAAFRYDNDITLDEVAEWMREVEDAGFVYVYSTSRARGRLGFIVNFRRHQRIDKPQAAKMPVPNWRDPAVAMVYARRDGFTCRHCNEPVNEQYSADGAGRALDPVCERIKSPAERPAGPDDPSNIAVVHVMCAKGYDPDAAPNRPRTGIPGTFQDDAKNAPGTFQERSSDPPEAVAAAGADVPGADHDEYADAVIYAGQSVPGTFAERSTTEGKGREGKGEGREEEPPPPDTLFDPPETAVPAVADAGKPRGASKKSRKSPAEPKPKPPADELTDAFWEVHGKGQAQAWVAIRGIVRTCLANEIPRNDLARALDLLARQGKAISGGTIQNALTEIRRPLQLLPGGASIPSPRMSATARALAEADRAGEEAKRLIYGSAG